MTLSAFSEPIVIEVVPAVSVGQLSELLGGRFPPVIDLRSSSEFADGHLPFAHNVPLFDDGERALVGLLYVKRSPEEAFRTGRAIVVEKAGALVERIGAIAGWSAPPAGAAELVQSWTARGIAPLERELTFARLSAVPEDAVVLHCWRGGLRSRSVAAMLRALGHTEVVMLEGGYRAWRHEVLEGLAAFQAPRAYVLRGLTGVGKTLVLREIERLRPRATIDLEEAAGHRSSLLGMVGLSPSSQKNFESRLFERTRRGVLSWILYEGESRKVGDVIVPPTVWSSLDHGTSIELVAGVERRIDVLLDDYLADPASRPELRRQLALVEARMPRLPLVELFDQGRERELVSLLLEHYYDPLYRHSERGRKYAHSVDASDPVLAAREIVAWIEAGR
jgi:tRNA 2-selenouridine synthase